MRPTFVCLLLLLLTGCVTSEARIAEPERGPAFESLRGVHEIRVLPVRLPAELVNAKGPDIDRMRKEWPMSGARHVSDGITERSQGRVKALAAAEKPADGLYLEVNVRYLDMGTGDRTVFNSAGSRAGWSRLQADLVITDAKSGQVAARLAADQSSGTGDMWEADMKEIGRQLGEWLDRR